MTTRCSLQVLTTAIIMALSGAISIPDSSAAVARPPAGSQALTELVLMVSGGVTTSTMPRARQLNCDPAGGNHPHQTMACHDLTAAHGNLDLLPGEPGKPCNGMYAPVTATALGEWRGSPIRFQRTYLNPCKLRASTGPVFQF